jgi:hypothetical protein
MGTPIAFNSGTTTTYTTGVFKRGTISLNLANTLASNTNWWNGVDVTATQYLIYSDIYSQGQSTFAGSRPTAWTTPDLTDASLIALINTLPDRVGLPIFTTVSQATNWLNQTGEYFLIKTGYENIVTTGLVANYDFGWYNSYIGSGSAFYDISGNSIVGTLYNGVGFSGNDNGYLSFDGADDYAQVTQTLSTPITICGWVKYNDQGQVTNTWIDISPHTVLVVSLNRTGIGDTYVYIGNGSSWLGAPGINASQKMLVNTWYHLAFVSNGSSSTLYMNGVNVGTSIYSPSGYGTSYRFGSIVYGSEWLDGNIATTTIYNTALTQAQILQNFNAQAYRFGVNNDVVTSGLVLYEDASNILSYPGTGTNWYDLSGNNNTGVLTNGPTFNSLGYITFDGTDDTVSISDNSTLNITTGISLEAIIYPTKSTGTQNVICKSSSSQNNGYIYPRTDNGWVDSIFYLNTTTGWNTLATTWPSLNNWHHTIATWDGSTMKIYINGQLSASLSVTGTITTNSNPLTIGNQPGYGEYYGGRINSNLVYNRALSATEVLQNYYGGNIVTDTLLLLLDASNLVSYPGSGSTWKNLLNGGSNGTLNGSAVYNSIAGGSIEFNGPTTFDYVTVSDTVTHKTGQDFSYECWVYFTNLSGFDKTIVGKVGCNIGLLQAGTSMGMTVFGPNGPCAAGNTHYTAYGTANTNVWEHWIGTYEVGVGIKTYKNGVLVNSAVVTGNIGNYPDTLFIGGSISANYSMDGYIQSAKTYSSCLTPLEVSQNFNANKARFGL